MNTIKKILVPVDFSPGGADALALAVDLSNRYEAGLTIINVNELMPSLLPSSTLPPSVLESWVSEANQLLEDTKLRALSAGAHRVETEFLQGKPYLEIVRFATEGHFDLIVMGTHGRTGVKHALIGSVAERVVRHAHCPVLTVRLAAAHGEHA
jgi:nucleotide-binding universal stress UspA family protein